MSWTVTIDLPCVDCDAKVSVYPELEPAPIYEIHPILCPACRELRQRWLDEVDAYMEPLGGGKTIRVEPMLGRMLV